MNDAGTFIAALGTLIVLAGIAGSVWAVLRTSAQEATIKRLREENEDYLRRLNYLEPRVDVLEARNEVLEQLHNPTEAMAALANQVTGLATQVRQLKDQEGKNHDETIGVLKKIDGHLIGRQP